MGPMASPLYLLTQAAPASRPARTSRATEGR